MKQSPVIRMMDEVKPLNWVCVLSYEDRQNPLKNAVQLGCTNYPTIITPSGVRFGLSSTDIYIHNGRVWVADPTDTSPNRLTIAAIITPVELRGKGLASEALKMVQEIAKRLSMVLVAEPVQIAKMGKHTRTRKQLVAWYKRNGWVERTSGCDRILEYK